MKFCSAEMLDLYHFINGDLEHSGTLREPLKNVSREALASDYSKLTNFMGAELCSDWSSSEQGYEQNLSLYKFAGLSRKTTQFRKIGTVDERSVVEPFLRQRLLLARSTWPITKPQCHAIRYGF